MHKNASPKADKSQQTSSEIPFTTFIQLDGRSPVPSQFRTPGTFTITRLQSPAGLPDGGPPDPSIRPNNQIFAVSLPHSMLPQDRARRVVEKVEEHLLTPFGLRSLAPSDRQYRGSYTGGPTERDGAYHQGTVWPWLLGPFITAYLKVNGRSEQARLQARAWLSPLESHLEEAGLGHVSEIFEGDPPHRPCGCVAQAWSVAELLRVYFEDVGAATEHAVKRSPIPKQKTASDPRPPMTRDFVHASVFRRLRLPWLPSLP